MIYKQIFWFIVTLFCLALSMLATADVVHKHSVEGNLFMVFTEAQSLVIAFGLIFGSVAIAVWAKSKPINKDEENNDVDS